MMTIEKIAARGGPEHLFGMWKRIFKPKTRVAKAIQGVPAGQTFGIATKETRTRAAAKAFKATKREAKKGLKKYKTEAQMVGLLGVGGAAGAGTERIRRHVEQKKKKK